jgi:hypothetical protein
MIRPEIRKHLKSLRAAFPKLALIAGLMILPALAQTGDSSMLRRLSMVTAAPGKQSFEVHFDDFSIRPLNTPPKED